jgi:hypothetical protein
MVLMDFGSFSQLLNYFRLISKVQKNVFFAIFDQKAWTIAHGFDGFWVIFIPFKLFSINFKGAKNMDFWSFLTKKHGL